MIGNKQESDNMNLYDKLNEIEQKHELNKNLRLKIYCIDGGVFEGYFDGYTDALDNEPKITQLELRRLNNYSGVVCILETETKSIEVI